MKSRLAEQQTALANALRNPQQLSYPDQSVEPRRQRVYQELIFNNLDSFLSGGFPVLRSLLSEEDWQALLRDFLIVHRSETPYFHQIGAEFLQFLQSEVPAQHALPPFALELAHYEYMEVVVDCAEDEISENCRFDGDLFAQPVVLSPVMCLMGYSWPVHRISVNSIPDQPLAEPVHLLVYRDRLLKVRFTELSTASVALLQALEQGSSAAEFVAAHHIKQAQVIRELLAQWREDGIVIGIQES